MKRREFIAASGALMAGSLLQTSTARAEDWPTHELSMILAFAAGSGADTIARMMAKLVSQELKVNVNVKNVLGGSGLTGFAEMVNSKPDGYTFGIVNVGALTVLPHVMQVPFKLEDVGFLSGFSLNSYGIGTAVNSDFKTVDDIVRIGKTRVVTYSTSTILNGFVLLQLGNLTGAKFRFVSANTNQEAVAQAAGGHVDLTVQGPADMVPLIDGGNLLGRQHGVEVRHMGGRKNRRVCGHRRQRGCPGEPFKTARVEPRRPAVPLPATQRDNCLNARPVARQRNVAGIGPGQVQPTFGR